MSLIKGYPEGSDITIMNATYQKPQKIECENSNGEIVTKNIDYMTIVYRDNVTQQKHHTVIKNPDYIYYMSNEGCEKPYNQFFEYKENVHPVKCKYKDILRSIAKNTGRLNEYEDNKFNGDFRANNILHTDPRVFGSDFNVEDHYRFRFSQEYTNSSFDIHKGFFDIEVDIINQAGDFPELGECPVNAISYYDNKLNKIMTYLLRDKNNPLIEVFEKETSTKELYNELYSFIINAVGGPDIADRYEVTGVTQEFIFFDSEISMINTFFQDVHKIDPDFMEAWNMAFDIPYLIQRIINLGYDAIDIMCNKEYEDEVKQVYYYIDERNKNKMAERTDYCIITGNVVWLDQLLQFCQKRKSSIGSFDSFRLDNIGRDTCGVQKLDYSHITHDIGKLPYLDYKTFVFYNIMDVIVQHCIEAKCKDLEYVLTCALVNNTSYRKCYRQTIYLADNRVNKDFYDKGLILGNNCNKIRAQLFNLTKPPKYAGAIVTTPVLTGDKPRKKINGVPSNIADNIIDGDFKALYPSTELENNIAPNTQIGKIILPEKIYDNEDALKQEKYERSGEFTENLMCQNSIEFAKRYLKYADFRQFIEEDLPEFISKFKKLFTSKFEVHRLYNPIKPCNDGKINPIHQYKEGEKINPIHEMVPEKSFNDYILDIKNSL